MNTLPAYDWALNLLIVQGAMGAFDTLYHHELTQDLPHSPRALELRIHAVRSVLYGLVFASIANVAFHGAWVAALAAVVVVEIVLTLWDFVVEDQSRKLPATERVLRCWPSTAARCSGMIAMQLAVWAHEPTAMQALDLGWRGWVLSLFAVGVTISGIRDGIAACRMRDACPLPIHSRGSRRERARHWRHWLRRRNPREPSARCRACGHVAGARSAARGLPVSRPRARRHVRRAVAAARAFRHGHQSRGGAGARCTLEQAPAGGAAGQPRRRDGIADALGPRPPRSSRARGSGIGDRLLRRARCRPAARRRQQRRQRLHVEAVPAMGQSARPLERHGVRSVVLRLGVVFGPAARCARCCCRTTSGWAGASATARR